MISENHFDAGHGGQISTKSTTRNSTSGRKQKKSKTKMKVNKSTNFNGLPEKQHAGKCGSKEHKKSSSGKKKKKKKTDSTKVSDDVVLCRSDGDISLMLSDVSLFEPTVQTSSTESGRRMDQFGLSDDRLPRSRRDEDSGSKINLPVPMYRQQQKMTIPTGSNDECLALGSSRSIMKTSTDDHSQFKESWTDRLNYHVRSTVKHLLHFRVLKIAQVVCAIYICIMTLKGGLRDSETGVVIDMDSDERTERGVLLVNGTERAIIGEDDFQVIAILIARLSAWFMYPTLVMVYISKFRATGSFLSRSPLAIYMYKDSHEIHVYCGWTILVCSLIHAVFHLARWTSQGNISLLWTHFSGITGMIIIFSSLLICLPMTILRKHMNFEIRKILHYLFIAFGLALCFHTPSSAVPNGGLSIYIFSILLGWYFLDASYCFFFMTEKIDTTHFSVLPSGVMMTMNVSENFQKMGGNGGICYVNLPWISKNQWHAFSLFENPSNPAERQVFISKRGDWTTSVHRALQRDTVRPCYINGPFLSPYNNADSYDNQILVASGIGITPALSIICAHKNHRRINLIWAVRDESLLQFFLQHLYLDHQGWNLIFYTGKEKICHPDLHSRSFNTNICIIEGRPKLDVVIPNIIYGIESGLGLPERYSPETKLVASEMIAQRYHRRSSQTKTKTVNNSIGLAEDLACYASDLGFCLTTERVEQCISQELSLGSLNLDYGYSDAIDLDRSGRTDDTMISNIVQNLAVGFRPWDIHCDASAYVKKLDKNLILPTWGILYCGGSKVVEEDLKKISEEYRIGLHVESFAW